jgi:phosphatidylethanolamine-binding protein (PEBP) family uncharacterized protein
MKSFSFGSLAFYSTHQAWTQQHGTNYQATNPKYKATQDALKKYEVIPDVVDEFTPSVELKVSFPKGDSKNGNLFAASDLHYIEPDVIFTPPDKNAFYTLVKVDPDAPSRTNHSQREWRHWLVVNIPGHDVNKGEVITPYMGPHPPKDSGAHRYVFLLYKQPDRITPAQLDNSGAHRGKWNVKAFAREFELGAPIGSAFYRAEY